MEWEEFKKKRFKEDPELKREYDKLEPEYRMIGQLIELRRKKRISQYELAKLMETKQPSIARLESGDYNPSFKFLKKLAEALDTTLEINFKEKAS